MAEADLDRELSTRVLESAERREVYADWLLERGDPRGAVLSAARLLKEASAKSALNRSAARLEVVAALKRLAVWLDEKVPEGRPWRPSDLRGVASDALGFLSHEDGVLHRFRVASGRDTPIPTSLLDALPTLTEVGLPAGPRARAGLSALALHPVRVMDALGPHGVERFDCFDVELPVSLARLGMPAVTEVAWRFAGFAEALERRKKTAELRFSDGSLAVDSLGALLCSCSNVSMLWLDRVRLPTDGVGELPVGSGRVPHLRLVETPLAAPVAEGLARAGAFRALTRLEVKDWPVGVPALDALMSGSPSLTDLSIIRSPIGIDLVRSLLESGRLAGLRSLDASGCLLALGGVARLIENAGPKLERLVLRFNQLTESDLASLAKLSRWPAGCEVRFEEVTFGAGAHQALATVANAHGLRIGVKDCVLSLSPRS